MIPSVRIPWNTLHEVDLTEPSTTIKDIVVEQTILGGETVYELE